MSYNLRSRSTAKLPNLSADQQHCSNGAINNGLVNGIPQSNNKKKLMKSTLSTNQLSELQKEEIQSLVLWRRPIQTIYHALHNMIELLNNWSILIIHHIGLCVLLTIIVLIFFLMLKLEGQHQPYMQYIYKRLSWCLYWCGLGILSSVGLGTGLHTFILYLGPHIASVTLAAYECNSLDFPEPPYPDEIICPTTTTSTSTTAAMAAAAATSSTMINVWSIMSKVRLEAFMWGAGTALGELPPYFISRAHRLALNNEGHDRDIDGNAADNGDDGILEELEEIQELIPDDDADDSTNDNDSRKKRSKNNASRNSGQNQISFIQTIKTKMIIMMKRMGFFGILACASIPNPLFDLAGIICGYSLISFWTFFGATLLGKAVIKMHIQKLVVIIVFNETYVQTVLSFCKNIPYIGHYIHDPLRDYLQQQKNSLHRGTNSGQMIDAKGSWISFIFESLVIIMVSYFMVSIINSMAQSDLKQYYQLKNKKKCSKDSKGTMEQHSNVLGDTAAHSGAGTSSSQNADSSGSSSCSSSLKKLDKND